MINNWEYKQLADVCTRILSKCNIQDSLFFDRLNDIRNIHKKYQSIVDGWIEYPHYTQRPTYKAEAAQVLMLYDDIKRICKEGNIESKFYKIPNDWQQFRSQFSDKRRYVDFYYNGYQITDAIVFIKLTTKEVVVPDLEQNEVESLDLGSDEIGIPGQKETIPGL